MIRNILLVMAVLALSACQAKKTEEAKVASVSATTSVATTPAVVAAPIVVKPIEGPVVAATPVPAASAPVPMAEAKPVASQPIAAPVVVQKPATPSAVAKPVVPVAPAAPKVAVAAISDADGIALAKKRNCFACHMIDKKVVGPAWKEVAAKYRGDAGAQARTEAKIGKGGSGAWGGMAMPPQPQVTAEERALLARFILNLK
jgi:cytochrome c